MEEYLVHFGVGWDNNPPGIGSGRYPHGSGENPNQHDYSLKTLVNKLRKEGLTDKEIAVQFFGDEHATANDIKTLLTIERVRERQINRQKAMELYEKTGSASEVARLMYGDPSKESSVRKLLDEAINDKQMRYQNTADFLKERLKQTDNGMIDIGADTELYLGVTKDTKNVAIKMLEEEGYVKTWVTEPQPNGKDLVRQVLALPGTEWKYIQQNKDKIETIVEFSPDEGLTFQLAKPPVSIDGDRVFIRYGDQGGTEKDGTIELRRGVDDISLGGPNYAQVRIAVDGKYYMKGMAFYSDNIPEGFDMVYNVNKKSGTPIEDVYKHLKDDKENPFGATIKAGGQPTYIGADGKEHQGVINKLSEEGDWNKWSKNIASQFLSKQNIDLIEKQIKVSILDRKAELDGIMNLTNPVIKQKLLDDFAESCDANAVSLSAKAPKGSAFQVLLPLTTLKDNEIYAPNYKNGEEVVLVRYPHGGIFEIPRLIVNNKNKEGDAIITKNGKDAVGIGQKTAEILSGADFDGDTAIVIPLTSTGTKVKNRNPLSGLINFDHKALYKLPDSAPEVKDSVKQKEMGVITNLITDMTVGGASFPEIERAVKHSMVVIDAVKHHLDMKASYKDNRIEELKVKYQMRDDGKYGGASTILSRASSEVFTNQRKEITDTKKMTEVQRKDFESGKHVYIDSGKMTKPVQKITDTKKMTSKELEDYKSGKTVYREKAPTLKQEKVSRMRLTDDATTLVRDKSNLKEMAYANYANSLKSLANQARKISRNLDLGKASPTAKETYKKEVESLNAQLRIAKSNSPKERQAIALGSASAKEKINNSAIELDYEHKQRIRAQEIEKARAVVGAKKTQITISDKEWEAIQAGAIAPTKLKSILNNTNQDKFKQLAMPKNKSSLSASEVSLIRQMKETGQYSNKDIADKLNVSASTVSKYLND